MAAEGTTLRGSAAVSASLFTLLLCLLAGMLVVQLETRERVTFEELPAAETAVAPQAAAAPVQQRAQPPPPPPLPLASPPPSLSPPPRRLLPRDGGGKKRGGGGKSRGAGGKNFGRGGRGKGKGRGGKGRGGRAAAASSAPSPPTTAASALALRCERAAYPLPRECRKTLPCDLRAFDPGRQFNLAVTNGKYGRERKWAENNVDPASRHFQNGVEWWVHHALPPAPTTAAGVAGARRVFVAAYFSYLFIFAPHMATRALDSTKKALGASWTRDPLRYATAFGHPGACIGGTSHVYRLLVDADLSCRDSKHAIAVPYVISQPSWLVAAELPGGHAAARSTLLFFRGHLPRPTIDTRNVRRVLLTKLAGQPGVVIEAATSLPNATYQPHDSYLARMLRSTFCLAPRGDTPSSRRVYEAIAAGAMPRNSRRNSWTAQFSHAAAALQAASRW